MSDNRRLEAIFDFVETCLAQAKEMSERDTGRLFGAPTAAQAKTLYVAFKKGRKKTVGDLVPILAGLRANIQNKYLSDSVDIQHPTRLISAEHIYLALQKLIALTPEEKQSLKLPIDDCEVLLNQAILNMALYQRPWNEDHLLTIYRNSTSLKQNSGHYHSEHPTRERINGWIKTVAEAFQKEQLGYEVSRAEKGHALDYVSHPVEQLKTVSKVTREINRILLKTGASQLQLAGVKSEDDYIGKFLPYSFIKRLTQSVVENELLTEEFSVFIENVTVERCGPFPLQIADTFSHHGTLSRLLLNFGQQLSDEPSYTELASHTVNKVTVHLYMRLSEDARSLLNPLVAASLIRVGNRGEELRFEVSSTGIGGTFSHVVRVLNFTLLNDVSCLRDYFPIAHEIMMEQDIVRSGAPAPVVAHSLVNLCKSKSLAQAMIASQPKGELMSYDYFAFDDPVGRGDFCGFDTLTSVANASLQARLKAIKLTGIAPQRYLTDLQESVNQYFLLRKAKSYLVGYPFSSLVQQSFLYRAFGNDWDRALTTQKDPVVYFEIQLAVTESFLAEGRYEKAKPYLQNLEKAIEETSNQEITWYLNFGTDIEPDPDFQIFSGTLLVRYELCHAHYHYLTNAPESAWLRLRRAEDHVHVRLAKYSLIKEVSQATFHPHYWLLSQIYFLRARLLMFFPFEPSNPVTSKRLRIATDVQHSNGLRSERAVHVGRLHLLEKARLYAACDGDSELYACITAYQCCAYVIIAASTMLPMKQLGSHKFDLSVEQSWDWARRLRNQALLSYAEAGRQHYYQIKEKSGISTQRQDNYGNFEIATVPTIREQRGDESLGLIEFTRTDNKVSEDILYLDMSILNLDEQLIRDDEFSGRDRGKSIYLFGPNACYLFFARGMYHLCSDDAEEFGERMKIRSLAEWRDKLAYAYRLFSYAWAIADDGGTLSVESDRGEEFSRVTRSFSVPAQVADFDKDVASIRDLYPHRVTDIASLGRLYASACAVLRGYTTTDEKKRQQYKTQLSWLLNDLFSEEACKQNKVQATLRQKKRYNDHLGLYLLRCRRHIEKEWQLVEDSGVLSEADIHKRRQHILKGLFSLRGEKA